MRKFLQTIDSALNHENLFEAKRLLNVGEASDYKKIEWKIYQFIIAVKYNQLKLAVIYLQEILKRSDVPSSFYVELGKLYIKKNNSSSALAVFNKGLIKFPLSIELLSDYIQCARRLKLINSRILQQRAGLLLSLIGFNSLKILTFCYEILLKTHVKIGALWVKESKIYGWIINSKNHEESVLLLGFSHLKNIKFTANEPTPALKKVGIGNGFNGFCLPIKDYCYQLDVMTDNKKRLFGSPVLTYSKDEKLSNPYRLNCKKEEKVDVIVDIIIPIFNNISGLKYGLNTLLKAKNFKIHYHLVLVDDCSTSKTIKSYLQQFKNTAHITVLHNTPNLGFIASVNKGMQQHPWRDVVLLNSDAVVVNNALERLKQLAYSNKKIATVTPLSNYAEKFSYPIPFKTNDLPTINDIKKTDGIAAKINQKHAVEVPTGNGFCFFIKRACLIEIGYFNQTDLLRGYSEESEFCLRATEKGWKHLCATNVYVGHEGGQSFKQERARLAYLNNELIKKKYPLYTEQVRRFIIEEHLKNARKRIESALLSQKKCDRLYVVDYFLNEHPLFKEQCKQAVFSGKEVWVLRVSYENAETTLQLFEVSYGLSNLEYNCLTQVFALIEDITKINPLAIEVHWSRYFPKVLNEILAKLSAPITVCPYDNGLLQQGSHTLWSKRIEHFHFINDYAKQQYKPYSKDKKNVFPDFFYKVPVTKTYSAYIAILGDINTEHQL